VKVKRVVLDVVVTDAKGNPVRGLKQNDFKISEDGVPQPVRFFDRHSSVATGATQQTLDLHLPPDTFANLELAPPDKPVTILLYDVLNTPQAALPRAHEALVKFIKNQKSSTRIAIFVLTDQLHMIQGFTDDETRLMAALDSKTANTRVSQLHLADASAEGTASLLAADPAATATAQAEPGGSDQATATAVQTRLGGADTPVGADTVLQMLTNGEAQESAYLLRQRLEITADAFTEIARFVAALPGRKNLIWMSGSFPSELLPNSTQATGGQNEFSNAIFLQDQVHEAQRVLKESRVAIYPVDIRGLQVDPRFSAATLYAGSPPTASNFGIEKGAEHATMEALADSTGGRAFYNTNGLQQALDTAAREGADYYSLTYAPSNGNEDGAERKIKVVLSNPNYQLYYRRRYLADDAAHPLPVQPLALDMNMQHGAPDSSELFFEAKVNPIGVPMVASANEFEALKTFLEKNALSKRSKIPEGPEMVQHYDINFVVVGRQLQMPQSANGLYATAMGFGLAAYMQDGEMLNGLQVSIKNSIPSVQYQKIEHQGYHASMVFAVPVSADSIRMAVRDEIGDHVGTMEIPLPVPLPKSTTAVAKATK
jgi:VWFA-related protein